jgi:hypothetical protein
MPSTSHSPPPSEPLTPNGKQFWKQMISRSFRDEEFRIVSFLIRTRNNADTMNNGNYMTDDNKKTFPL